MDKCECGNLIITMREVTNNQCSECDIKKEKLKEDIAEEVDEEKEAKADAILNRMEGD